MQSLSQGKIDELLKECTLDIDSDEIYLTNGEKDALGEAVNISMGTAATAISTMLNKEVRITTPTVTVTKTSNFNCKSMEPAIGIGISYLKGLLGNNVLLLKQSDVKIIVDLLMGGEGNEFSEELDEIQLSAISEVMNQMMGASSTALSNFFSRTINISTPTVYKLLAEEDSISLVCQEVSEHIVCIRLKLFIGDMIESEIMNIMSLPFAKELSGFMLNTGKQSQTQKMSDKNTQSMNSNYIPDQPIKRAASPKPVQVSSITYKNFDDEPPADSPILPGNMNLIMDVPLLVTVEIGKTQKPVRDILEFTQGSIIELDKQAGDPAEIIVNGQLIARGDIVVIDDNFGIRITEIISPNDRIAIQM